MFSCQSPCSVAPYVSSRDPDFHRQLVVRRWSIARPKCECLVCVRMEPIRGPVWDDPVPKEPYKLKEPPWMSRPSDRNPCETAAVSSVVDEGPPAEWTRRERRNAVWEINLDPELISPTACADTQSEDLDACYRVCFCTRRNGLQDTCPLTGCGGKPPCLTTPQPSCEPSGFAPPSRTNDKYLKRAEFILCPAKLNQRNGSRPKRPPYSTPATNDESYASHCDSRNIQTY